MIVGDAQLCEQFKHSLKTDYRVRDYGQPESYLGMEFARDRDHGTVSLSQSAYIRSMASRFGLLHEPPVLTPMDSDVRLTARESDEDAVDGTLYRAIVGSLLIHMSIFRITPKTGTLDGTKAPLHIMLVCTIIVASMNYLSL